MKRINDKVLNQEVETLAELMGVELTISLWHRHCAVHILLDAGACGFQIAVGITKREVYEQVEAACNALKYMKSKGLEVKRGK